jgi:hypothetical protein
MLEEMVDRFKIQKPYPEFINELLSPDSPQATSSGNLVSQSSNNSMSTSS